MQFSRKNANFFMNRYNWGHITLDNLSPSFKMTLVFLQISSNLILDDHNYQINYIFFFVKSITFSVIHFQLNFNLLDN